VPSLFERLRDRVTRERARRSLARRGVHLGDGVVCHGFPVVSLAPESTIHIGDRVVLTSDSAFTALGVSHPVVLRTLLPGATIEIAEDVGVSGGSICAALRVTIGAGSMLGADVTIVDTDFHPIRSSDRRYAPIPAPLPSDAVHIGRNVFIGTGAILLKGSRVEDNAVVGARAVVSGTVPSGTIVAGNPARILDADRQD
jgi:acetyltransferase-like isoleucine patch superfamily enzyme